MLKTITEPARETPVVYEKDVVVVGGGPGGIIAATASGRNGADTLLVEQYGFLGGMATAGLMTSFNGFRNERPPNRLQTVKGIPQEVAMELAKLGGTTLDIAHKVDREIMEGDLPYAVGFDPETLKLVALKMVKSAGVKIMLHTYMVGVIVENNVIKGVIVENKSGRQAVLAKIVIDATGDGDVAATAGAPFVKAKKEGERMMNMSLMYRLANVHPEKIERPRGIVIRNTIVKWGASVSGRDGIDFEDLTEAEIEAREKTVSMLEDLRKEPGYEDSYLIQTAAHIGVRETRRFIGEYMITEEDALKGARFEDVVAISSNPVPSYYGKRFFFDHEGFDIPYRSLVPKKIDSLLLAGRCISAHQVPFQSLRSMAPLMALSQAAGTAGALCARDNVAPRRLDVSKLQKTLVEQKAELRLTSGC